MLLEMKKNKFVNRKIQRVNRKRKNVENPLTGENEIYSGDTLHVANKLARKYKT